MTEKVGGEITGTKYETFGSGRHIIKRAETDE
jgi:hypothetical protein